MPKKILFLFHEDSKSGAPNALLSFLNYIKEHHHKDFLIDIFVLNSKKGIEAELRSVSRNFFIKRKKKNLIGKIVKVFNPSIKLIHLLHKYDLVYGNTVLTLKYLATLKQQNSSLKTILHVHESTFMCSILLNKEQAIHQFKQIDQIITVSQAAVHNLVQSYHINKDLISIIYPTIQNSPLTPSKIESKHKNVLNIVTIGHPNLTKGTDLIPQIASILKSRNNSLNFKFFIVGVLNENEYIKSIKLDIQKLNLNNYIELIPHTNTPEKFLEIADIFLIPSREDSFSLVGIEAAYNNKPIVAFNNAIGLQDILNKDCIFLAEYLNLYDVVTQIELIINNPSLTIQKQTLAKLKCEEFLNFETVNKKQLLILKNLLNN